MTLRRVMEAHVMENHFKRRSRLAAVDSGLGLAANIGVLVGMIFSLLLIIDAALFYLRRNYRRELQAAWWDGTERGVARVTRPRSGRHGLG